MKMKNLNKKFTIEQINHGLHNSTSHALGIYFVSITEDYLQAEMPVNEKTRQPRGILHGGSSVVLAETIGSVGGYLCLESEEFMCVGLEINANHIASIDSGTVVGTGKPIHVGKRTQVWDIQIHEKNTNRLICVSRLTLAIVPKK